MSVPPTSDPQTPAWVVDSIFYQIFPDRFARGAHSPVLHFLEPWNASPTPYGFKGGDLYGIVEHLDYLQDLGVTALSLNPIFKSTTNHRYHTFDYYEVDPLLGGNSAFQSLIEAMRARGMHLVLDGVFNHASRGFFQFNHVLENGPNSPYVNWWHIRGFPLRAYEPNFQYSGWAGLPALPKFNTNTPEVREFLLGVGEHWVRQGIDGWRLDVPNEINDDAFWQEFRQRTKLLNPELYIVGEIWEDARRWLQGDQYDAVMNYLFTAACLGFFVQDVDIELLAGSGLASTRHLNAEQFAARIDELLVLYHLNIVKVQFNLLDGHDMARFLTLARGDRSALRLATLFQMTYIGAPVIYYGDEIGTEGGRDPDCRRSFNWDQAAWDHDLHDYFRRCIALRRGSPALRRGSYQRLYAAQGLYVFMRQLEQETLVIALNTAHQAQTVQLSQSAFLPLAEWRPELGSGELLQGEYGIELRNIPARTGVVWKNV